MQKSFLTAAILFMFIAQGLFSQSTPMDQRVRDSLMMVMPNETQLQKAVIYLEVARLIKNSMPEKAFSYMVSALKISILQKSDSLKAKTMAQMGSYNGERYNYLVAQDQLIGAWKTYKSIGDTVNEIYVIASIGMLNRSLKNYKSSLWHLQLGLALAKKANNLTLQGNMLEQSGHTYQAMGDFETASAFFTKALTIFRQEGDRNGVYRLQLSIGSLFMTEGRDEEALMLYTTLMHDTAFTDKEQLGILYTCTGHIYYKRKDFRKSLEYNRKALEQRLLKRLPNQINSSLINIAADFYKLGIPDSGQRYMDSGMILAQRYKRPVLLENCYYHLYTYNAGIGNYKLAFNYYSRYCLIQEKNNLDRYRSNIAIIETNQELLQSQQSEKRITTQYKIQSLNYKLQVFQSVILEILIILATISMVVFLLWLFRVRRLRRQMQELNVQLSEEIIERETAEKLSSERENQYKFITDNSDDLITHMDHRNNLIYASPASMKVFGYEVDEILTKSMHDLTHPDQHAFTEAKYAEMLESRSSTQLIFKARKKDGSVFWVESILNPLFDPISGVFKGVVGVTRDIQERKTKEIEIMEVTKQKENLLKEIHHRVKNNFAILVSLINMQMAQTKNPELIQSLTNLQLRIRTMALVHEMLYRSGDFEKISFPGYLRSLASVIAGTYNRRDVELSVEADEVVMDIESLIPLGLIINELLSNAYKHAFPDGRTGKIQICFTLDQQSGLNTLVVRDDGIGLPGDMKLEQYKTMGFQIVQILCTQIEAALLVANDPGACFTITFRSSEI